ncbi:MAG: hypothetical protein A3K53_10325 [Deltaproteobacteria bacterium RIFOXYB2_FULL_66_7]|nr:MAG: hypothetical protein A3K53_10325 [Deltaproteobacteria bacterium RIFOXYB2_FULL_66_7]
MAAPMVFEEKGKFLERLRGLVREGVPGERIRVITPFGVPEVEEILPRGRSNVRFFALVGAASGTVTGFAFTILTSLSWPLIVGGKPIVSLPPFLIIAFALTILFGALSTFAGFLLLSRLPSLRGIRSGEEYGNAFVILVEDGERR